MAYDAFLKIDGIKGESQDAKHKGEIDIMSFSFGMTQQGSHATGGGGGSGKVSFQDLHFVKRVDSSSPLLFLNCANGAHIKEVNLTVRKAGDKPVEYLKITMKDLLISSVSTGGSGGEDRLTESVTLNFAQFKEEYTPQKPDGSGDAAIEGAFHIAKNVKL